MKINKICIYCVYPIRPEPNFMVGGILHIPPKPKVKSGFDNFCAKRCRKVRVKFITVNPDFCIKKGWKVRGVETNFYRGLFSDLVKSPCHQDYCHCNSGNIPPFRLGSTTMRDNSRVYNIGLRQGQSIVVRYNVYYEYNGIRMPSSKSMSVWFFYP